MPRPQRIDDEHDTQSPEASPFATSFMNFAEMGWTWATNVGRATGMLAPVDPKPELTSKAKTGAKEYRVGEYYADYSLLTPEEIAAPDPELDALFKRSKPVSR